MNRLFLFIVFVLGAFSAKAQVTTSFFQEKDAFRSFPMLRYARSQEYATKTMPYGVDTERLLKEDRANEAGGFGPTRFGYGFEVKYTLQDGAWEKSDSERIWSLKIASPGAYALSLVNE